MAKVPIIGNPGALFPGLSKCQTSVLFPVILVLVQPVGGVVPLAEEKSSFNT